MDLSPTALLGSLKSDLGRTLGADLANYEGQLSFLPVADPRFVAGKLLVDSFLKKYQEDRKDAKAADRSAFDLFMQWNQRCADWQVPKPANEFDSLLIGEFRSCFQQCFELPDGGLLDFSELVPQYFRTGPGAAVDARMTDAYTKLYAGPLSTTSDDLYWHYYDSTLPFELENEAERIRSASFETPVVRGSKLGFAPKNREISRTRCTEPSLPMVYQLGTGKVLEDVIRRVFSIDLSTQPDCNRELSRLGSLHGHVGTTDLSSASDATSRKFWRWAMPYNEVHDWFTWIRSSETAHPFKKGEWVKLHMLSSMGNGYTFPLMTLIFLCVVQAVYRSLDIPIVRNRKVATAHGKELTIPGNFGVFGDDIIVVTEAFEQTNHLLELLGYKVNREKSFGAGPFRESCGTDWFIGHNVRGVYCKRLSSPQYRYALINRLNAWSSEWDIPLPSVMHLLKRSVWWLPVPPWENADSGVIVPLEAFRAPKRDEYGGFKYSGMRPIVATWDPLKGLTERHYHRDGDIKSVRANDGEPPFVNSFGAILCAVKGHLRGGEISVRSDAPQTRYKKARLTTPGWGFSGESTVGFTRSGWARFESSLAYINLGLEKPEVDGPIVA